MDNQISGFLLLDKQPGLTSFEALGAAKRALGTGKVGHTGTLDKFASGLLVVLAGRALRLSPWVSHCGKTYLGTIRFGEETDTLDPEGQVVARAAPPDREQVEGILAQFRGEILQAPPAYSAIHLGGRRASELARAGEKPEMEKRPVTIYELELLAWEPPLGRIRVSCSGGVYIRSLARDIALACGSRAHLAALRRTAVAGFSVEAAFPPEAPLAREALRPIDRAFFEALGIPRLEGEPPLLEPLIHGRPLGPLLAGLEPSGETGDPRAPGSGRGRAAAVFAGDQFAAMVEWSGNGWTYGCVYARRPPENPPSC
ncbi:MAG: tRNA pseudouridine(55) synthase TruB [Treponema sp.]|jgi:tRNA pseudouridine55 synthase|nr:tRNA pseudouridine(55) synthase TruB [Treponema sp.]